MIDELLVTNLMIVNLIVTNLIDDLGNKEEPRSRGKQKIDTHTKNL